MVINYMHFVLRFIISLFLLNFWISSNSLAQSTDEDFAVWLIKYKKYAITKGVSEQTLETAFKNVKYLKQVIKYDRKQPEFFEDTITYVSKRANQS